MQTVPNIVRERLKARPPVGSHPDADVLTAFAERSLPAVERAVVLEHVARCGDCRDVIALALPATEAVLPAPGPVRTRTPWVTWPALRWGLVAAGIIVVAAFGLLQYRSRPEGAMVAKQSLPQVAAPESRTEPAGSSQPVQDQGSAVTHSFDSLSTGRAKTMLAAPKTPLKTEAPVPGPTTSAEAHAAFFRGTPGGGTIGGRTGAPAGGPIQSGPRMPAQWQQAGQARVQVPATTAPSAVAKQEGGELDAKNIPPPSEVVEVQSSAPQMETEASTATVQTQSDEVGFKVDKAKAATAASAETAQATVAAPRALNETVVLEAAAVTPRWTITAAGGLQRSLDLGNTWQNIDVTASTMVANNFTSLAVMENSRAQKKDKKKEKTAATSPDASPAASPVVSPALVFRAVTASGPQVWAGGSGGVLYHSVDAGNQWIRVVPVSGGTALTSDIVAVEFSDAQHGTITTSTSEVWSTADAGQSWHKQ